MTAGRPGAAAVLTLCLVLLLFLDLVAGVALAALWLSR
jgi:hypothetical protein